MNRRLAKAMHLLRTGGPLALIREISDSLWLRLRLSAMAHRTTAELDGCSFSLRTIPSSFTKLFLLTDRYELPERRAVKQHLRRDLPVVELGGSLGVVACVTNRLLNNPAAHLVVEANPLAIPQLQMNKESNGCSFTIVNRAIAYGVETVTFCPTIDLAANSIEGGAGVQGTEASVTVEATQLGELLQEQGFDIYCLVCDIEGKEYELVFREGEVLKRAEVIIMETHARIIGEEKNKLMMNELDRLGFQVVEEDASVVTLRQTAPATK